MFPYICGHRKIITSNSTFKTLLEQLYRKLNNKFRLCCKRYRKYITKYIANAAL